MEIETLYHHYLNSAGISIDSRSIIPNQIFFALSGENVNGNAYAEMALKSGAFKVVIDDPIYFSSGDERHILVSSVLDSLQELAKWHRRNLKIPVIGITGSVGKTTTKELIAAVLAKKYRVQYSKGNFNNHIGVPITLLSITPAHEIAIIEMGANHIGEIHSLCEMADPEYGLITRIGKAHLEGFGSLEGVIRAKSELYQHVSSRGGVLFVNSDNQLLMETAKQFDCRQILYNSTETARLDEAGATLKVEMLDQNDKISIQTKLPGIYNFENILAAIAIGQFFNVKVDQIKQALETFESKSNRSQLVESGTTTYLLDAYNANPVSMPEALKSFYSYPTTKTKIIVLGDMRELGNTSKAEHQAILEILNLQKWSHVILVGPEFKSAGIINEYKYFDDVIELKPWFDSLNLEQTMVLLKGSRGVALEKLVQHLIMPDSIH